MLNSVLVCLSIYPEQQKRADKTSFLIGVLNNRNRPSCLSQVLYCTVKAMAQNKTKKKKPEIARSVSFRKETGQDLKKKRAAAGSKDISNKIHERDKEKAWDKRSAAWSIRDEDFFPP